MMEINRNTFFSVEFQSKNRTDVSKFLILLQSCDIVNTLLNITFAAIFTNTVGWVLTIYYLLYQHLQYETEFTIKFKHIK